jgi:hypothetical protein
MNYGFTSLSQTLTRRVRVWERDRLRDFAS